MNRDQAIDVLETIDELYPKYELTERKANMLLPQLMRMDYDRVLQNLSTYIAQYPYPPTLAEIAAYPKEEQNYVDQLQQWKKEADLVSEETKQKFRQQMDRLLKECRSL
ncbi:hypothetical protein NC661_04395 [Aquibacillus koreensis]|uniref:Replicative helicase inhibitor G39P N-terminal domain-containing protein n=1 Tax=Aquibacillus koreensis TaxID=279446 RepID=A0A9X4AIR4_9BACI|nr:hypothetical protein [Aquibacillus koreensis]MCT2534786.1 hypothetical protein [Aquibacillus koreensis]MDC3419603.1 hypothetical protein [Aquibacillus koreensis]